jgi:hypothetical protein
VRLRSVTLLAVAAAVGAAVPAGATTSQEAVDFLNQQRGANGIPQSATFDEHKTTGCRNHNEYMAQNGLGHGEDPGKPGYTPEGADYNNSGEVAAQGGGGWSASTNPWDAAPLHQAILFDPRVGKSGYDESDKGFFCMRLELVFSNPPTPVFYAYTGNLGPQRVPPREVVCCEGPYAPQEAVGIDQGVPTGPNILFFSRGFGFNNHAASFSLTGPGGAPVEAKFVDSTTQPPPQGQGYKAFYTGGDLIPVQPLDPFTDYTATVVWANDDDPGAPQQTQVVPFKTDGFQRGLALVLSKKLARGRKATLTAPGEAAGQKAKVKIGLLKKGKKKARTVSTKTITLKGSQKIKVPRAPRRGRAVVTVTLPSFVLGDTRFTVTPAKRKYH